VLDPRTIITEDSFRVEPGLLGTPLARPWRRATAMAIDGVLVAILANAPSVLFGLAAAYVLFRISSGPERQGYLRASARLVLRFWAAVMLFVAVVMIWGTVSKWGGSPDDEESAEVSSPSPAVPSPPQFSGLAGLEVAADVIALTRANTEAEARTRAERLVSVMRAQGVAPEEIREMLDALRPTEARPWLGTIGDSLGLALGGTPPAGDGVRDSLAVELAAALAEGDSARAAPLRAQLASALAADTVEALRERLDAARARERSLRAELEEERSGGGIMSLLRSLADDLGLGLGWSGLYFTAFVALWNGYTPGKRLLRIRIIRLDGKPLGWWLAFERFGGYAASVATGLLGFLQIAWDRNRQGIHDKIAETVVINT